MFLASLFCIFIYVSLALATQRPHMSTIPFHSLQILSCRAHAPATRRSMTIHRANSVLNRWLRLLSIFLCRFIFNLRNADYQQNDPCASTMSIGFVSASGSFIDRVLDNIAAPISGAESSPEEQLALSPISMDYSQEKQNEANCESC